MNKKVFYKLFLKDIASNETIHLVGIDEDAANKLFKTNNYKMRRKIYFKYISKFVNIHALQDFQVEVLEWMLNHTNYSWVIDKNDTHHHPFKSAGIV